jgi:uncharacterized protein involved in exopolysaccharide biosynthesis
MSDSLHFLKPYLRGWPIILGAMVLAFLIANKYLNYVTPLYESTAKLRLADMNEGVPNSNLFKDLDVFATTQKINAEIELLKSYALISKALTKIPFEVQIFRSGSIRKTELFEESPILIQPLEWNEKLKDVDFQLKVNRNNEISVTDSQGQTYNGVLGDTILIKNSLAVFKLNDRLLAEKENLQIADEYIFTVLSRSKQISQINTAIDIIAVDKDVPVIRISFKASHPEKAAMLPNALAEAYIEDYIENKFGAANVTVDFLNDRISEISQKLDESEQRILNYRDRQSITNIQQETETDLRKISQLKIQHTNLKMSLEAIRDLENYIQSGKDKFLELAPNFEAFTDLLSTEIIKNIKQLQAEKKDLLLQYTEKDEKVVVIDAKLKDLTSYLTESITNTRKNLETKFEKLSMDIQSAEEVFVTVPEKERMLTILNREFEIYQQSYNFLNQKKIEAEIAKAAKIAFHRVITPATSSKVPVSPNRTIIKIVAPIMGMMAALVLIFAVHTLKASVNDLATVEGNSMIPVAATFPKLVNSKERFNYFTKILTEWEVKGLMKSPGITCFSGFALNHGMSFIAHQLLEVMVQQERNVLLIELSENFNIGSGDFWKLKKINDQLSHMEVNAPHTLSTAKWQEFIQKATIGYDQTILINTLFGTAYTMATMQVADLNLLCIDTRRTPAKRIHEANLIQEEFQIPNLFFAINRIGFVPSLIMQVYKYLYVFAVTVHQKLKRWKA